MIGPARSRSWSGQRAVEVRPIALPIAIATTVAEGAPLKGNGMPSQFIVGTPFCRSRSIMTGPIMIDHNRPELPPTASRMGTWQTSAQE